MQKLLIEKWIIFSLKKKILSIFSNCDERKIIILNPKKKKKASSHTWSACDEASYILREFRKLVITFFTLKNTLNLINLFLFFKKKK